MSSIWQTATFFVCISYLLSNFLLHDLKEHNRKSEWINNKERELKELREVLRLLYTWNHSENDRKKYRNGKQQVIIIYMDSGFENSCLSTIDELFKWVYAKKQIYSNGELKERKIWSKKLLKMELTPAAIDW